MVQRSGMEWNKPYIQSDGYELHMNTMGWKISDEHYSLWKANVGGRFKAPQEKKAVAGKLKGEMGLRSTAVYCRTISGN